MSPNEFKQYKRKEFNDALQKRCDDEGITLQTLGSIQATMFGLSPNDNAIYLLNNEAYTLFNNGNKIQWDFVGQVR